MKLLFLSKFWRSDLPASKWSTRSIGSSFDLLFLLGELAAVSLGDEVIPETGSLISMMLLNKDGILRSIGLLICNHVALRCCLSISSQSNNILLMRERCQVRLVSMM